MKKLIFSSILSLALFFGVYGISFAQLDVTVTAVLDPTCSAPNGGRIDVNVSGGTTPYTLVLFESFAPQPDIPSGGPNNFFFDGLGEGTYFVFATDGSENDVTPNVILSITQPVINILPPLPIDICENAGNQDLTSLVTASIGGGTFSFSGLGVSGTDFNPATLSGLVTVDVTYEINAPTCVVTEQIFYNVNDSPDPNLTVSDPVICNPPTGDVVITITGAETGVTYELTDGGTPLVPAVTGMGAGVDLDLTILQADAPSSSITYTVVASIPGCPDTNLTDQAVVTVNDTPDVGLTVNDPIICNPATGNVIITITGAETGVTYEVTNGGIPLVPVVTGVGAGVDLDLTILQANAPTADITYTIQATVAGCPTVDLTDPAVVTVDDAPDNSLAVSDVTICNPAESNITITITGAEAGVTYEVTDGGTPLTPAVTGLGAGADLDLTILQANAPTVTISYTIVASIGGCTDVNLTDAADVTVNDSPDANLAVSDAVICNPATGNVTITITGAEAGVTYELTNGGTPLIPAVTGLGAGVDLDLTILQANAPTATISYTVVASIAGCTDVNLTDPADVTVNDAPDNSLAVSDAAICNPATGNVTITVTGAEAGVTYELTNGGIPLVPAVTGLGAGADLDLTILQANAPAADISYTVEASVGGCATVNLTDLAVVTVTNAPNTALAVSDASECNPASGNVIFTITGAETGVTYELTDGGTPLVPAVTGLGAGVDLDLTILQANVPTTTTTYTVVASIAPCSNVNLTDQPVLTIIDTPDVGLTVSDPVICNPATGNVIITITGAEIGVTYEVTNGGIPLVPPVTGVGAGVDLDLTILQANAPTADITYTIEATVAGCPTVDLTDPAVVTVDDAPDNSLAVSDVTICNPAESNITITITGAEAGVTYEVTDGGTPLTPAVTGLGAGADLDLTILQANAPTVTISYTIVASIGGCTDVNLTDAADVTVNDSPDANLAVSDAVICNPATGNVTITITGAEAGVTYELTNGGTPLIPAVTGLGAGVDLDLTILQANAPTATISYTVVASIAGCTDVNLTDPADVTVNDAPDNSLAVSDAAICNPATGNVTITVTGAEAGVTYELTNGGIPLVPAVTGLGAGADLDLTILQANAPAADISYTVEASVGGCATVNLTDLAVVTVTNAPNTALAVSDASECNPASGNVIFTITGAETGVTYELTDGGTPLVPAITGLGAGVDLDLTILQANVPTTTTTYTVVASIASCSNINLTDQPVLTITDTPAINLTVSDPVICNPATGNVTITVTGAEAGVTYEVTNGGVPLVPVVTGVGAGVDLDLTILQANAPTADITYTIQATVAVCPTVDLTDQAIVTVNAAPDNSLAVSDVTICNPAESDITITITAAEAGVTYEVTDGGTPLTPAVTGLGAGADLDLTILQANAPTVTISYIIVASIGGCTDLNLTDAADVTVNDSPDANLAVSDAVICNPATGNVTITVTGAEAGVTYELTNGGTPLIPVVTGLGAGVDLDLTILQANAPTATISYTVVASIAGCTDVSLTDLADVVVNVAPVNGLTVSDEAICNPAEGDVTITVTGAEAGVTYELTNGGIPLVPAVTGLGAGADLDLTILQANAPAADISYTVEASVGGCATVNLTDLAVVTVTNSPNTALAVSDASECNPASGNVIFTITGAETGVTYELTDAGTPLVPAVTGLGAGVDLDLTILQANVPTTTTTYTVVASIASCSNVNLTDQPVLSILTPDVNLAVSDPGVCNPALGDVIVTITGAEAGVTYELTDGGIPLVPVVTGVGAGVDLDLTILQANAPTADITYTIEATNAGCPTVNLIDQAVIVVSTGAPAFTPAISGAAASCNDQVETYTSTTDPDVVSYRWFLNTVEVIGETANTIDIDLSTRPLGTNNLVVRGVNGCGESADSPQFDFEVEEAATIDTQPGDQISCEGDDVTFNVSASGTTPTYQWQVDDGSGFTDITGETANSLTLSLVDLTLDGNLYQVIVGNVTCPSSISTPATLTVNELTTINTQPVDQSVNSGDDATFTVAAAGSNLVYQWEESTDGGTIFSFMLGENSASVVLTAVDNSLDGNQYRVITTGDCNILTSDPAELTVVSPPDCSNFLVMVDSTVEASCNLDDGQFLLSGNGTLPYTVEVFVDDGSTTPILSQSDTLVIGLAPNTYRYEITDAEGCFFAEGGIIIEEKQIVAEYSDPVDSECIGELGGLVITITEGGGNHEYSIDQTTWTAFISGDTVLIAPGDYSGVFVRDAIGEYCPTNSGAITIGEPTTITYTINEPTESFPERPSGTITITDVAGGTPGYEVRADLVAPSSPYPGQSYSLPFTTIPFVPELGKFEIVLSDLFAGTYMIQIRDLNGCIVDVLYEGMDPEVPLDDNLFIPNVFTPNSDGSNDFFFIRNLPDDTDTKLTVTNRYGKQVYGSVSYNNDWDGEGLPDGVYYYIVVINVEGQEFDYNGWVEIWSGL